MPLEFKILADDESAVVLHNDSGTMQTAATFRPDPQGRSAYVQAEAYIAEKRLRILTRKLRDLTNKIYTYDDFDKIDELPALLDAVSTAHTIHRVMLIKMRHATNSQD